MIEPLRRESPDEDLPRPKLRRLRELMEGPFGVRSLALTGLFILAAFYTLYLGRSFFLPIVLALLFSFLLRPVVRGLKRRLRIPEGLGAALVVFGLLGAAGLGIYELAGPAYEWAEKAPRQLRQLERKLAQLKKPVQTMSKATEQVEKIARVGRSSASQPRRVEVQGETFGERMFSQTTEFIAGAVVMFILLFFLLASGDHFLRKLIRVVPSLADKKQAADVAHRIESDVSTYLVTITVINIGLGLATWGALALLGVPNPLLWGVMAALTNYIPYLGALFMFAVLTAVGFLSFKTLGQSLMVPGVFLVLNLLERYLVTPMVLGRRLTLNPVVIFIGLTFWGWLWGITGALLAVPIMVVFKIICDHSAPLAPLGELLGD